MDSFAKQSFKAILDSLLEKKVYPLPYTVSFTDGVKRTDTPDTFLHELECIIKDNMERPINKISDFLSYETDRDLSKTYTHELGETLKKEFSENKTFQLKQLIVDEDEIRAMLRIIGREQTRKYGS